ncbi:DUF4262 domain-containing protein [Aureimonas pseudogalii]|uniref:DUF4262 domain-containing protein n=1 Tax=Aureimonas pseudogalii TaxID=1744844 RepID=A0A7W6H8P1_9HYPH|nr:DUF4262 domain-containing protein [Aureimonas pseudogalii]MBB4000481.1 hypothetical protein [Aureimonas pseudogalii]
MRTVLDVPAKTLDTSEMAFVAEVREHGFIRTEVSGDREGPGFSYSTGFWVTTSQPEFIMFGMMGEAAHTVFWDLYRDAQAQAALSFGKKTDRVFANLPACIFPIAKRFYADHLGWSRWFYRGDEFPCLQVVWPDREGVFPWEAGFDPAFSDRQSDLTEQGWQASLVV